MWRSEAGHSAYGCNLLPGTSHYMLFNYLFVQLESVKRDPVQFIIVQMDTKLKWIAGQVVKCSVTPCSIDICSNNYLFNYRDVKIISVQLTISGVGFVQFLSSLNGFCQIDMDPIFRTVSTKISPASLWSCQSGVRFARFRSRFHLRFYPILRGENRF